MTANHASENSFGYLGPRLIATLGTRVPKLEEKLFLLLCLLKEPSGVNIISTVNNQTGQVTVEPIDTNCLQPRRAACPGGDPVVNEPLSVWKVFPNCLMFAQNELWIDIKLISCQCWMSPFAWVGIGNTSGRGLL